MAGQILSFIKRHAETQLSIETMAFISAVWAAQPFLGKANVKAQSNCKFLLEILLE